MDRANNHVGWCVSCYSGEKIMKGAAAAVLGVQTVKALLDKHRDLLHSNIEHHHSD